MIDMIKTQRDISPIHVGSIGGRLIERACWIETYTRLLLDIYIHLSKEGIPSPELDGK
ncbi:hypothetical protein SDC9_181776 [bioreactor metagenome]|uniref:Uncharacterized protein n=1 Tax=bioreactor metagenome TaxID=1076179 RepID=A0A645HF11_9ZZZZ